MGTAIGVHHRPGKPALATQCGYLVAEIPILRSHVSGRLRLSDPERPTLAEIAKRLGGKQLAEVACVAQPEIILAGIVF